MNASQTPLKTSLTKQELIDAFLANHRELAGYVNSLPPNKFMHSADGKWAAGQQLRHVYLCLLPFPKALASKEFLLQKFGKIDRPVWDYDIVIANYFKTSLKAPERFLPEQVHFEEIEKLTADLQEILSVIQNQLNGYTDKELDSLVLPHPLLGNLTIREMFYLMTYHATHHLRQIEKALKSNTST